MNILDCTIVPVEVRNFPAFLPECILSNTNYANGLQFSSYATASKIFQILHPGKTALSGKLRHT
jgi:hypothetical protein